MLKNVIFDFGGVLYEYDSEHILRHFFDEADCSLVSPVIYRDWAALDAGTADYDEYAAQTVTLLPERLSENVRNFFHHWCDVNPPMEQTWALVGRLKARGYGIYLISNAPTEMASRPYPILKLFDGVVFSAPLRMVKPDRAIFEYALRTFGLNAGESLFVDDMAVNVEGAKRCGLYGYVYKGDADRLLAYIESLSR